MSFDRVFLSIVKSKSKMFLAFCFSFLAGVVAASIFGRPNIMYLLSFIIFLLFLLGVFWKNKHIRFGVVVLLCCGVGVLRYASAFPPVPSSYGEREITGFIAAEPDVRIGDTRYVIQRNEGRVYLTTGLYPPYQYGDIVSVRCRLEAPEPFDGFRYDMYLARLGVFSICRDPQVQKIGGGEGNFMLRYILAFKYHVSSIITRLWPEPYASFMAGLLYGYRGGLGEWNEKFANAGVSHIVAISGYNITIIAVMLITLFTYLRIRRQRAFWFVVSLIALFVLFVGASPSVVRAGIMGILVLVAKQIGRLSRPTNLLAAAAAAMVLHNPLVLVWDAGFQLSFAATIGILYLAPFAEKRADKYWRRRFLPLRDMAIQTMSAILATLPFVLYHFGRFSLVAPIINLLILWVIPWLMLAGTAAIAISIFSLKLGMIIAWVSWVGMRYILVIVDWFSMH